MLNSDLRDIIFDETFFDAKRYVESLLKSCDDIDKLSPSDKYVIHLDQCLFRRIRYFKYEATVKNHGMEIVYINSANRYYKFEPYELFVFIFNKRYGKNISYKDIITITIKEIDENTYEEWME
jgi:hypothetical protein